MARCPARGRRRWSSSDSPTPSATATASMRSSAGSGRRVAGRPTGWHRTRRPTPRRWCERVPTRWWTRQRSSTWKPRRPTTSRRPRRWRALSARDRPVPLTVGAVRGQVGHVGAASAAAGLVKACLALHHQVLPPAVADPARSGVIAVSLVHAAAVLAGRRGGAPPGDRRRHRGGRVGGACRAGGVRAAQPADGSNSQPLGARPEAVFAVEADDWTACSTGWFPSPTSPPGGSTGRSSSWPAPGSGIIPSSRTAGGR